MASYDGKGVRELRREMIEIRHSNIRYFSGEIKSFAEQHAKKDYGEFPNTVLQRFLTTHPGIVRYFHIASDEVLDKFDENSPEYQFIQDMQIAVEDIKRVFGST